MGSQIFAIGKNDSVDSIAPGIPINQDKKTSIVIPILKFTRNMFKQMKKNLIAENNISRNLIKFQDGQLFIETMNPNPEELKTKILSYVKQFEQKHLQTIKISIYPNQIEFLQINAKFLKKLENSNNLQIKINSSSIKHCHFELVYQKKTLSFLNDRIEDCYVDAIVNTHSEILLNSETLSEGVNKDILKKAGECYKKELHEYNLKKGKLASSQLIITSSGDINSCKKIINLSVPHYDEKNWEWLLADSFANIINESERNEFSSIALPLLGTGVLGLPLDVVFKTLIRVFQEKFFLGELNSLKEIYLCEIDQIKIKTIKDMMNDWKKGNIVKDEVKYQWKWRNDKYEFEAYDENINKIIDKAYELYQNKTLMAPLEIYFNITRTPGTHQFDLNKMTVLDISTGKEEK